jgi:naphthalene 1,2-dioxygenase system ferredoxin subunit
MTRSDDTPWTDIAAADTLAPDDVATVAGPAGEIALYSVAGQVFATDNQCSHGNARLCEGFLLDHEIECPLHQGRFDVRTGAATCEPAMAAIRCYPVKVEGGRVWLQLD